MSDLDTIVVGGWSASQNDRTHTHTQHCLPTLFTHTVYAHYLPTLFYTHYLPTLFTHTVLLHRMTVETANASATNSAIFVRTVSGASKGWRVLQQPTSMDEDSMVSVNRFI